MIEVHHVVEGPAGAPVVVLSNSIGAALRMWDPQVPALWLRRMMLDTPAEGYAGCCAVIEKLDLEPRLAEIRAPTLVIAGAEDPATPPAHAERIVAAVAGARLEVISPARHLANVERVDEINGLLRDHLEG